MHVATYNGHSATQLAELADDAVRGINHLTIDSSSLRYPCELYRVLANLSSMSYRLRQTLAQLDRLAQSWATAGLLRIDGGDFDADPAAAIAELSARLSLAATPAVAQLSCALAEAQSAIAWASLADSDQILDRPAG